MRILALRLQNLNSLKGVFEIDFMAPPLAGAGIFAITGRTGAGKTTLLDGICLALYGRTPRLGRGQAVADVLTRHTGECFAEVDFAVDQGRFRSHWSQRRARGRAEGALQPPRMELCAIEPDGEARGLESGVGKVPGEIEQLTGLNFERFTQSMLLAQGSFAAFLNAPARDRAELLEQMTGSQIYAQLSVAAFERNREEEGRLEQLQQREGDIKVLAPEELAQRRERLASLTQQSEEAAVRVQALQAECLWLEQIRSLESQVALTAAEQRENEAAAAQAEPDLQRLAQAQRAESVRPAYEVVQSTRTQIAALDTRQAAEAETLPQLQAQVETQQARVTAAATALAEFAAGDSAAESRYRAMRRADDRIQGQGQLVAQESAAWNQAQAGVKTLEASLENAGNTVAEIVAKQAEVNAYREAHRVDESLLESVSGLGERLSRWAALERTATRLGEEAAALAERSRKKSEQVSALERDLKKADAQQAAVAARRGQLQNEHEQALGEASIDGWTGRVQVLTERQAALGLALESAAGVAALDEEMSGVKAALATARTDLEKKERQGAELTAQKEHEDAILEQLLAAEQRERLVARYEDERARLAPGEPCPLCGATEHPWGEGAPPPAGLAEVLKKQKARLRQLDGAVSRLSGELGECRAAVSEGDRRLERCTEQRERLIATLASRCRDLAVEPGGATPAALQALSTETGAELGRCRGILVSLLAQRRELDALLDEEHEAEASAAGCRTRRETALQERRQLTGSLAELETRLAQTREEAAAAAACLGTELQVLGLGMPPVEKVPEMIAALRARAERYRSNRDKGAALRDQHAAAEQERRALEGRVAEGRKAAAERLAALTRLRQVLDELTKQRREQFGEEQPESEEKTRAEERQRLTKVCSEGQAQLAHVQGQLRDHTAAMASRAETIAGLRQRLLEHEAQLAGELERQGFASTEAFAAARLDQDALTALQQRKEALQTRKTQLQTRLHDLQQRLESETRRDLTRATAAEAEQALAEATKRQQELLTDIGALKQELQTQEDLRQQRADLVAAIDAQRRECARWGRLNALIGSADGRKFRTFAQGLTLEVLVRLANEHLARLTDRYRLERAAANDAPLELEIVDTYQADTRRPPGTLSGGETFLVSLALALGLSSLASRRTRIDSLFLDEGFGALDAEALDIALDALNGLHAAGKTIGVISHVEQLKERVPVRIEVHKLPGGISTLGELFRRR